MAFLTIDDAPSRRFEEKLAYLKDKRIPAVFFCVGRAIEVNEAILVEALSAGFALGNHSYTHARFSTLSLEDCFREIERTDVLLHSIYARASVPWTDKYFRFPYLDQGGTPERASRIQDRLKKLGYGGPAAQEGARADTLCTFDQKEYYLGKPEAPDGLGLVEGILGLIDGAHPSQDDILLIHDHENTHELFFECIGRYLRNGIRFDPLR
jgi:peptidoglycan/xylan/chitin deacetylase (PgdA/CDA1 family)